jgi:putative membrane protein
MRKAFFASSLVAVALAGCGAEHTARSPDNAAPSPATGVTAAQPGDLWDGGTGGTAGIGAKAADPAPTIAPPPSTMAPPPSTIAPPPSTTVDAGAPHAAPLALTDEEILQVTHTANLEEIRQGALAQAKATDLRVRKLANMMINDHMGADARCIILAKKDGLDLAPSPVSTSLRSDAQTATSSLETKRGPDFDRTYVDAQVKEHQALLDVIDEKLVPAAKSPHVQAYLAELRPKMAMLLQHAKELQSAMGSGSSATR